MRQPLLTLVVTYAIAILGLTLIPGVDADGNAWHMNFFHAFYFVSYMATTIGFGEIPHEFSDAQRMWVTFSVYATVVVWIYAIGTLLSLVQDSAFQHAVTEKKFARRIRSLTEPFYLICGYGETGSELVQDLINHNQHAVVIDIDPKRTSLLELQNLRDFVPALCADARRPLHLLEAGLKHEQCASVVAVTNDNEANLKIAITSKLLNKDLKVICRADSHDVEANMASFGTDRIIDPYDTFGKTLSTALKSPCLYLLQQWLTGMSNEILREPVYPPAEGKWVVCGYGRFGKAIYRRLRKKGLDVVVVEMSPEITGQPYDNFVHGRGTEAVTLKEADIENAIGLVAGTDDDANNLSIIVTGLELNPDLFTIARQNVKENQELFDAVECDMVMNPGNIIANRIRTLLAMPMLYDFLALALRQNDDWACELISRISGAITDEVPDVWEMKIDEHDAHAVIELQERGFSVRLGDIQRDRYHDSDMLNVVALLHESEAGRVLLPENDAQLAPGDRLLLCAGKGVKRDMEWALQNQNVMEFILSGKNQVQSKLLRYFYGG